MVFDGVRSYSLIKLDSIRLHRSGFLGLHKSPICANSIKQECHYRIVQKWNFTVSSSLYNSLKTGHNSQISEFESIMILKKEKPSEEGIGVVSDRFISLSHLYLSADCFDGMIHQ